MFFDALIAEEDTETGRPRDFIRHDIVCSAQQVVVMH